MRRFGYWRPGAKRSARPWRNSGGGGKSEPLRFSDRTLLVAVHLRAYGATVDNLRVQESERVGVRWQPSPEFNAKVGLPTVARSPFRRAKVGGGGGSRTRVRKHIVKE